MIRRSLKKLEIDTRSAADIEAKVDELSFQYETGWKPDPENPDVGTTIAKLYARSAEENIGRINEILERYHTEFVNMLDISLLPARPASSIVVMDMLSDTISGAPVPKGTKLLTDTDEPFVFETDHSLYVTGSRINTVFATDGESGSIIPVFGRFLKPSILDEEPEEIEIEEFEPFSLFSAQEGIEQYAASFYHPYVFDTENEDIQIKIEGNKQLCDLIEAGDFEFCYPSESKELLPVSSIEREALDTFVIKSAANGDFDTIMLRAKRAPRAPYKVERVSFSSRGAFVNAEAVNTGANDMNVTRFMPFTDTLSLYSECYVGHDRYFSKAGARIIIEFDLLTDQHRISLNPLEEQVELKIIKRRTAQVRKEVYADCFAQEVAIEYYNGTGYKRLPLDVDERNLFMEERAKHIVLSFICPDDWEESSSGSYHGRSFRFSLIKCDNCYVRPAVHHYPIIKDLRISYSYEDRFVDAWNAKLWFGTGVKDITSNLLDEKGFVVMEKSLYNEDALYIGLSRRIENGPASILFKLEDARRFTGLKTRFEYFGYDGWRQMKVLDYTRDFSRSGVVMFMPPSDMKETVLEGNRNYFIRVLRVKKEKEDEDRTALPRIAAIALNAVFVSNIETRPEVPIYIDEAVPDMRFSLGDGNVLDAAVWVNEFGRFSRDTMLRMAADDPENISLETDPQGQVMNFFVKWKETERFETADDPRVYQLDRLNNLLIFGDGIHTAIPRVIDDVAVKLILRCCNGRMGNVDDNTITSSAVNLDYIGGITNPVKAYGGSNIESIDNALERGAGILSSRNRLVSMEDYKRAILSYSDAIDQVSGIAGMTPDGKDDPAQICFMLLMRDHEEGSFAFHRIMGGLKEELLSHCELTLNPDKLLLMEPIYVDISVNVWVDVVSLDDSFEIQGMLYDSLREYLDPLGYGSGGGWKIGSMPRKPQILMRLDVLKSRAVVKKSVMIARYTDAEGEHETDLSELKVTPFMIPRSGDHKVHILY
ncbi:MAG: hypothetical protein J6X66_01145 [Lachnospiraceae bacterium]|nr:hypothetical protein [Lachnospiraceae bacterium]